MVIVIKSFKPPSFNIDEILYAEVSEKDEMTTRDKITKKCNNNNGYKWQARDNRKFS